MAKVSVECPGCFAKLNLPDRSKLGKKIKCPKCAEIFVAEAPDDDDTEILDEDDAPAKSSNRRKRPTAGGGKKPSKKSGGSSGGNNGLLIGGGVAALLVVVVAGLYFGGVFGGKKPLPAPPAAVVEAAPPPVVAAPKVEITPTEKMLALRWMPADTELILHVKVADIWQAPLLKGLIENPQTATQVKEMQKYIGVGPADIESVTLGVSDLKGIQSAAMMASMGMQPAAKQFKGLVVARSKKPLSQSAILQASPELKSADHNGKSYFLLPSPPGQPADEAGGWVVDANTFVMGGLNELKSAMDKGETVTPRKELSFVDATSHVVLVMAPKDPQEMSQGQTPPSLPGMPPQIAEMQQALTESMQGFGLGINIRGGFDLQTSLLLKDSAGAAKVKAGLEAALVEGRKQFDAVKATAPPLLGDLGQMLIDNLKINEQSQVVKVSTNIPDSAQQQLEQLPPLLMVMAMTGGLNPLAGGPGAGGSPAGPGPANFSPGAIGDMKKPGETEAVDAVKAEGLPDGIMLSARTSWSEFPSFGADGKETLPIQLMLDAKGEGLNTICAFGQVTAKTMTLDGGGSLKTAKSTMMFGPDPLKSMVPFEVGDNFGFEHPEGTMRVKFSVEPPTGTAAKITALEGTFKYLTAEKSDEFTIAEVAKKALKPLADPELKAAGVKLLFTKGSNAGGETLALSCGKGHFLGKTGISDPDDANGVTQFFHSEVDKGQTVYRIQASDQGGKFSEKLQVKFKLYRDVKEHTVSFRFENVPLPKPDSKPKSQTQQN